ncbi:MAG TPA: D-alanyl-D-alanine carboxypeptidase family protein [Candidatus Hydrogenedentes bacterium]|nr:D-alanyl-D-alanine carboxypeptidase family protein [Candidatus Hydrogenedentota bacterium]HOS01484.1 D-alanyl-D-alanine carboxypeptidase family protein [Candidatus Hydrogenedentota bacterium]
MRGLRLGLVFRIWAIVVLSAGVTFPPEAQGRAAASATQNRATVKKTPVKQPSAQKAPVKKTVVKKAVPKSRQTVPARTAPPQEETRSEEASVAGLSSSMICVEENSGLELYARNVDMERPPASLVKMLLMLLVAEGIQEEKWTLETPVAITRRAAETPPSKVGVREGETWPLGHLMLGVAVLSANDAAMAVAEGLWGSEDAYKQRMNARAQELGMTHSEFHSVHGLPPVNGDKPDRATARDLALLARTCVRHPQIMQWAGTKEFQFRPDEAPRQCTNKLLLRMTDCDGLKTGFTRAAGHCIAATAERDGVRLISVVMGCENRLVRFNAAEDLLNEGFRQVTRHRVLTAGQEVTPAAPVRNAAVDSVRLGVSEDVWVVMKKDDVAKLTYRLRQEKPLRAPLRSGDVLAHLDVVVDDNVLTTVPLGVKQDLAAAGWGWKLRHGVAAGISAG